MSKINWSEALIDYLKDEKSSYASIAIKYRVSLQSVKKRGVKDGWQELRRKTITIVDQKLSEKVADRLIEIKERQARLGVLLQMKALKIIKEESPKNYEEAVRAIKTGIKIEREALDC